MVKKVDELSCLANDLSPDVIIVETWAHMGIKTSLLNIPGYEIDEDLRRDRCDTNQGVGGGLLVYVRSGLSVLTLDSHNGIDFNQYCRFGKGDEPRQMECLPGLQTAQLTSIQYGLIIQPSGNSRRKMPVRW
jgi:hypothetical protein